MNSKNKPRIKERVKWLIGEIESYPVVVPKRLNDNPFCTKEFAKKRIMEAFKEWL